jgi:Recombinase
MSRIAQKGNVASTIVRRAVDAKRNEDLVPVTADIRNAGLTKPQQIANRLNELDISTPGSGAWSAVQVRRILASVVSC